MRRGSNLAAARVATPVRSADPSDGNEGRERKGRTKSGSEYPEERASERAAASEGRGVGEGGRQKERSFVVVGGGVFFC